MKFTKENDYIFLWIRKGCLKFRKGDSTAIHIIIAVQKKKTIDIIDTNLKIIYINTRGIRNKKNYIESVLLEQKPVFLMFFKIWLC